MKPFSSLLRQLLFWLLFFAFQRLVFIAFYAGFMRSRGITVSEIPGSFFHALQLDLSTAAYILLFPFVILLLQSLKPWQGFDKINRYYTSLIIFIYLLISIGEIGLYGEWNTKLSYKALVYLERPGEVIRSASTFDLLIYFFMIVSEWLLFTWLYRKVFYPASKAKKKVKIPVFIAFAIVVSGFLVIAMRGGIGEIPITTSRSYFSKHSFLNHAAVNPAYNIAFSMIDFFQIESQSHFHFMPDAEAIEIVDDLHQQEKDTTILILNQERPNIVMIFLESWPGDLIESLGGEPGLTPEFHRIEKEGLLFTSFYATGNRSQQALASVFGGLPALPITTLTDHPQKYPSVPSLIKNLNATDYYTSFYFGGNLNYGNIRSYLIYNHFDRLVEQDEFDDNAPAGKLGVHDEALFAKLLQEIGQQPQPFFTATLTLSSHSPYDYPGDRPIDFIETENNFVNSAHYTDKWLGWFIQEAKKKSWYENTLFIILSDHSHLSYKHYSVESFNYRHIPLLLLGGALSPEYRGKQNDHLGQNSDLTATLLHQLKLNDEEFFWSKNMLNPYSPQFAYFELNDGFGWKRPYGLLETNVNVPFDYFTDVPKDKLEAFRKEGQAYVQVLFRDFLEY